MMIPAFTVRIGEAGEAWTLIGGKKFILTTEKLLQIKAKLPETERGVGGYYYVHGEKGVAILPPEVYETLKA